MMRKQLNVRLVTWVIGSTVVLATAVHLLHALQVRRNAGALVRQALRAEQEGHVSQAIRFLGDYVARAPHDTDALAHYAALLTRQNTPAASARALAVYERLIREEDDPTKHRREAVRLALRLEQYATAERHLNLLLQAAPGDGEVEHQMAVCAELRREYTQAAVWYEKALNHRPAQVESYQRLAVLQRNHINEPEQAEQTIDRLTEANPKLAAAWLARGLYHKDMGDPQEAKKALDRALELAPGDAATLLASAELAQGSGDAAPARARLRQLLAAQPRQWAAAVALARMERDSGRPADCEAILRQGLQAFPNQSDLLFHLAEGLIDDGRAAEAEVLVERMARLGVFAPTLAYLQARLQLQRGEVLEAARKLEELRQLFTVQGELVTRIHLALGLCYEQIGDLDLRLNTLRRAVSIAPLSGAARAGLVAALVATGRLDEARGEAWQLTALRSPPPYGWLLLARLLVLDNLRRPLTQRDWAEVSRILDRAVAATPSAVEVPILRATVLAAQQRHRRSAEVLRQAVEQQPDRPELLAALAEATEQAGDPEMALCLLEGARSKLGHSVPIHLALARFWMRRLPADDEARRQLAGLESRTDDMPDRERTSVLAGLAELHGQFGTPADAVRLLGRVAERRPADLGVRLQLFDRALLAGDKETQQRMLGELRRIEGDDGVRWRYAEAVYLYQRAKCCEPAASTQARKRLAEAVARRPNWSRLALLAAHLDELDGKPAHALENYLRAIDLGDNQPVVIRRAVQLLSEHDPQNPAARTLSQFPK